MSIVKQIHAFLEVSGKFLQQARVDLVNDGWDTLEEVGTKRGVREVDGIAPLVHPFIGNESAGGGH
ncbi:hypothetical protein FHW21_006564 [Paraburkholderia sp. WP4_3_2]|nr:hypothetical protein [Paraburkholderia sp. WP4_3_2]